MSVIKNKEGLVIRNKPLEQVELTSEISITRMQGGSLDGQFNLNLSFEGGDLRIFLSPEAIADLLSQKFVKTKTFLKGNINPKRKYQCVKLSLMGIPKKFLLTSKLTYDERDDIAKQPRLQEYVFTAMKAAKIQHAVVTFRRSNTPSKDYLEIQEVEDI